MKQRCEVRTLKTLTSVLSLSWAQVISLIGTKSISICITNYHTSSKVEWFWRVLFGNYPVIFSKIFWCHFLESLGCMGCILVQLCFNWNLLRFDTGASGRNSFEMIYSCRLGKLLTPSSVLWICVKTTVFNAYRTQFAKKERDWESWIRAIECPLTLWTYF